MADSDIGIGTTRGGITSG